MKHEIVCESFNVNTICGDVKSGILGETKGHLKFCPFPKLSCKRKLFKALFFTFTLSKFLIFSPIWSCKTFPSSHTYDNCHKVPKKSPKWLFHTNITSWIQIWPRFDDLLYKKTWIFSIFVRNFAKIKFYFSILRKKKG